MNLCLTMPFSINVCVVYICFTNPCFFNSVHVELMHQSSPYVIINQGIAKLLSGYPIYTWGGFFEPPPLLKS